MVTMTAAATTIFSMTNTHTQKEKEKKVSSTINTTKHVIHMCAGHMFVSKKKKKNRTIEFANKLLHTQLVQCPECYWQASICEQYCSFPQKTSSPTLCHYCYALLTIRTWQLSLSKSLHTRLQLQQQSCMSTASINRPSRSVQSKGS